MKFIRIITAALCLSSASAHAAPPADYKLVWQDEFKGTQLDLTKWTPQTYKRDDARLSVSALTIEKDGLRIHSYTKDGTHYTGFLKSADGFAVTYGYFESRIRFHGAPAEHCAFWVQSPTIGKVVGDPQHSGVEVDVIEHRVNDAKGKDISHLAAFNLHWDGYGADHKRLKSEWISAESLNDIWHTYAVLWTPQEYVYYVDDVERWRTSTVVSQAPQVLRLTCEIKDSAWAGKIPVGGYGPFEQSPYGMDVNWVRVWQKP